MGYIQFEFIASPAHNPEFVLPAFPVQMWREIGAASRQQQSLQPLQYVAPYGPIGCQWKDQWHATEIFYRSNIPGAEKVGRFFPSPLLAVAGIEVRRDADDGLHSSILSAPGPAAGPAGEQAQAE